ncbi:hypothetical protein MKX03_015584, partial [Papaver bracteatum]
FEASSQSLLVMVSMLQLGHSSLLLHPTDNVSYDKIVLCIRLLCKTRDEITKDMMLADKQFRVTEEIKSKAQISHAQPDDLIDFYHLKSRKLNLIFSYPVYAEAYVIVHHYDIVLDIMVINHT